MRRVFGDALMSVGALILLLLALIAVDERVRDEVTLRLRNPRPAAVGIERAGARARDLFSVVSDAAREQALEHAPLLLFAFAGTALVLFMIRT